MDNYKQKNQPQPVLKKKDGEIPKTPEEKKLQRSDPQETELKGFLDPNEELEVKGTDNPF
jgi:hypothetical protein